jgi:hypothetical protein
MTTAAPVREPIPRSDELRATFVSAYLACPDALDSAAEALSSLGYDGAGLELVATCKVATDYDDPAAAVEEDSK